MATIILKLGTSRKEAFKRGFIKGLGAPGILFGDFDLDPEAALKEFKPLPVRRLGSVAEDWAQVGNDMRAAIVGG